eukprot:gene25838-31204_t
MFVRAPNNLKAKDRVCDRLSPLIFASCSPVEVDQNIRGTIDQFKRTFGTPGRLFRGEIVLSFFDRREIKEWAGLVTRQENFYFERWHLPITIIPSSNPNLNPQQISNNAIPNRRHSTGSTDLHTMALGPEGMGGGSLEGDVDYNDAYRSAYDQVTKVMMTVLESANQFSDHVPLTSYHYELHMGEVRDEDRRRSASLAKHAL